jgi:hypothetical protein
MTYMEEKKELFLSISTASINLLIFRDCITCLPVPSLSLPVVFRAFFALRYARPNISATMVLEI